jgi:hypothetical protein
LIAGTGSENEKRGCVSVYCQPSSSLPAGGPVKSEVGYSIMGSVGNPCDPSLAPHHP